jgi:hypothetical protein
LLQQIGGESPRDPSCHGCSLKSVAEAQMTRMVLMARVGELNPARVTRAGTRLRLAWTSGVVRGPEKYALLDLRRRRAQIRARRVLGLE